MKIKMDHYCIFSHTHDSDWDRAGLDQVNVTVLADISLVKAGLVGAEPRSRRRVLKLPAPATVLRPGGTGTETFSKKSLGPG